MKAHRNTKPLESLGVCHARIFTQCLELERKKMIQCRWGATKEEIKAPNLLIKTVQLAATDAEKFKTRSANIPEF